MRASDVDSDPMLGQEVLPGFAPTILERRNGTVKWFESEKGFGFLTDYGGADYFVCSEWIVSDDHRTPNKRQGVIFVPGAS